MPSGRIPDSRMSEYVTVKKINVCVPNEVYERLIKFCEKEERGKSYVAAKAIDMWLKKQGY